MTFLIETIQHEQFTELLKFYRDVNGIKHTESIRRFRPYFYVLDNELVTNDSRITSVERGYTGIKGEKLKKIYVKRSKHIKELSFNFDKTYEADVMFQQRYIIDKLGEIAPYQLRINYIDIELDSDDIFPDLTNPNQAVTCVSILDSFTNEHITILYQPEDAKNKVEETKDIKIVNTEEQLLTLLLKYIKNFDPDIISGWNCLDKDTHIHTKQGIKTLENIKVGDVLYNGDTVKNKHHSYKQVREFGSNFGVLKTSEDHKFLVINNKHNYKSLKSLTKNNGKFIKVKDITNGFLKLPYDFNNNKDYNIDNNILYLLGMIYTDGTIDKYRVHIYNNNKTIINRLTKIQKIFNDSSKITKDRRHKNTTFRISFTKHKLISYLNYILNDDKKELNIEKLSLLSSKQFAIFCSGLIDGDGSKNMIQVNQHAKYKEINGFHNLLIKNGILGSRYKEKNNYGNRFHIISIENKVVLNTIRNTVCCKYKINNIHTSTKKNRTTNKPKYFLDRKNKIIYSYISENRKLNKKTEMIDIETTSHTFLTPFITHNCDEFDMNYLYRRMEKLGIDPNKFSPMGWSYINDFRGKQTVKVRGRIVSDMMANYMHFRKMSNQGKAASYNLEFTGQAVLGVGKIKHVENFHEMWVNHPKLLIEYNKRDNQLVKDINDKLNIIDFFNQIRCKACAQLTQIYSATALINGLLLRRLKDKLVLPTHEFGIGDRYEGAYVMLPIPGLYQNVFAFDVKAMYPNIIKTFNMGYETFNPEGKIQIEEGVGFDPGIGIISQTVRDLESERDFWKKKRKEATNQADWEEANYKQYAIKVLTNSIYGYLGYPKSPLYLKPVANAITNVGRQIIKWTASLLEKRGYIVVYGDTDSVYFSAKSTGMMNLLKEGAKLRKIINASYSEFVKQFNVNECTIEMEFEKIFDTILFVKKKNDKEGLGAKKKYAYIPMWLGGDKVEDKIEYTGFATVRSDSPQIARDTQKRVIELILRKHTIQEVLAYLKTIDLDIRMGKVSPEMFAIPGAITKPLYKYGETTEGRKAGTPPVIQGARYANQYLGTRFREGMKPKWIYVKAVPPGYPDTHIITFQHEIPEGYKPDYDKIAERIFKMKLENIFQSIGWGDFPILNPKNVALTEFM